MRLLLGSSNLGSVRVRRRFTHRLVISATALWFGCSSGSCTSAFLPPSLVSCHRRRLFAISSIIPPRIIKDPTNTIMSPPEEAPKSSTAVGATTASSSTSAAAEVVVVDGSTNSKPMPSFYQRKLPESCISFASKAGKKIFASALSHHGLKSFFPLIQQFTTQSEPAYCGLSTLVLVLNALSVDPRQNWKGPWRWYEESMLNCCLDLERVKSTGITLRDFQCLAFCQGLSVDLQYCYSAGGSDEDSDVVDGRANGNNSTTTTTAPTTGLDDFRIAVQRACVEDDDNDDDNEDEDDPLIEVLVISYHRKVMGQTGSGHFSPIAAYDSQSDSVLILDTARFKYGAHWAKLPLVYEAMKPIDPDTGRPRGYALLSFTPPSTTTTSTATTTTTDDVIAIERNIQPVSRLFRSRMSQRGDREKYKQFLQSVKDENQTQEVSWEDVLSYWTDNGGTEEIWKFVEPIRLPGKNQEDENVIVESMLQLLRDMLASHGGKTNCCAAKDQPNSQVPCISEETAIYAIYLASLSDTTRREMIMTFDGSSSTAMGTSSSTLTKEHLICEAEMLASAIDTSDQVSLS